MQYTLPVMSSRRLESGAVECGMASFIVLNSDGWILTAAHVIRDLITFQEHIKEKREYDDRVKALTSNTKLSASQRRKQIKRLVKNNSWIVNHSLLWGAPGSRVREFHADGPADIAIGKLEPFEQSDFPVCATFKDPSQAMPTGTSLCRLGFPFYQINADFDEGAGVFRMDGSLFPVPFFPNEGIHTRLSVRVHPQSGRKVTFVETSSPGLKGQSGGPILDRDGAVWALQSHTMHLPLGFSPQIKEKGKVLTEHQFMHVGYGTHVQEIINLLEQHKVAYTLSK